MNKYNFTVYNRRHDREVTYILTKTNTGWHIQYIAINGECTPDGSPLFYANFDQDNINYPSGFNRFLEFIWTSLNNAVLSTPDAQEKLQELADWVSSCERAQPEWKGWN